MNRSFPGGVWPVMLTPFTAEGAVDYSALDALVDWYIAEGSQGLFAVCQSSEMFFLTEQERLDIAAAVVKRSAGRVPVIASGHVADAIEEQAKHIIDMANTGVDAVVLLTNRLAKADEGPEVWVANLKKLLSMIPENICLGLYECPYPYKRVMSLEEIRFCAESGRFYFLKDTSCDMENIRMKLKIIEGSRLKLYNANSATLLESLRCGAVGYSGVMANMQCKLYAHLCDNIQDPAIDALAEILTMCAIIEAHLYPVVAKVYLNRNGVTMEAKCRVKDEKDMNASILGEIDALESLTCRLEKHYL